VFVIRDGVARRVAVTGETGGGQVALKSGDAADAARPGDVVVVEGQADLQEGAKVEVVKSGATP
jgi:hypothetical protein